MISPTDLCMSSHITQWHEFFKCSDGTMTHWSPICYGSQRSPSRNRSGRFKMISRHHSTSHSNRPQLGCSKGA